MTDRLRRARVHLGAGLGLALALAAIGHAQDGAPAQPDRDDRLAAHLRTGRYADARRLIDEMLKDGPRSDLENTRAVFASGPNMRVRHTPASFACEVTDRGVLLPAAVNGRPVSWLMDTGANASIISDAEAIRLGLEIQDSTGRASDMAGGSIGVRIAIARRIVIGRTRFEHVPLLVTPAEGMPWKELPPGKQGILGLPLFIGFDALRWTRAGTCHTGSAARQGQPPSAPATRRPPNLHYHQLHVIAQAQTGDRPLEFILDSGNQAGTQLWQRFAEDFASDVKAHGRTGSATVTQFGGKTEHAITILPALPLMLGGKETRLADVRLFPPPVGNSRFHGLLGMDVLSQAAEVTIDFRAMTLTLR